MIDMTTQMMYRVGELNDESTRISYQMSTGKVLENGSDDSVLYAQVLNIEDKISIYDGLAKQIDKTVSQNNVANSTMDEIKLSLDNIHSDMLKTLNEGMNLTSRSAIAVNLNGMRENLLTLSNTTVDGEYILSGSNTTLKTFTKDDNFDLNGKISYGGDAILRNVAVEPNTYRDRGITAYDALMYSASEAGRGETLSFYVNERIIDEDGLEWKLNAGKTATATPVVVTKVTVSLPS
jgi:flagellar hook-associated protein 3 FlgL